MTERMIDGDELLRLIDGVRGLTYIDGDKFIKQSLVLELIRSRISESSVPLHSQIGDSTVTEAWDKLRELLASNPTDEACGAFIVNYGEDLLAGRNTALPLHERIAQMQKEGYALLSEAHGLWMANR